MKADRERKNAREAREPKSGRRGARKAGPAAARLPEAAPLGPESYAGVDARGEAQPPRMDRAG